MKKLLIKDNTTHRCNYCNNKSVVKIILQDSSKKKKKKVYACDICFKDVVKKAFDIFEDKSE